MFYLPFVQSASWSEEAERTVKSREECKQKINNSIVATTYLKGKRALTGSGESLLTAKRVLPSPQQSQRNVFIYKLIVKCSTRSKRDYHTPRTRHGTRNRQIHIWLVRAMVIPRHHRHIVARPGQGIWSDPMTKGTDTRRHRSTSTHRIWQTLRPSTTPIRHAPNEGRRGTKAASAWI